MTETNKCPHCDKDLRDKPIPEDVREFYGEKEYYMKTIGVEIYGLYDGVLFWMCPFCEGKWHRWPEGDYRREKAENYFEQMEIKEAMGREGR